MGPVCFFQTPKFRPLKQPMFGLQDAPFRPNFYQNKLRKGMTDTIIVYAINKQQNASIYCILQG